nr:hypothetical protein [uncultured Albidiferax sp.]
MGGLFFLYFGGRRKTTSIELDHTIVPSRDKVAAARMLAELLDVPWAPSGLGPFAPLYLNTGTSPTGTSGRS